MLLGLVTGLHDQISVQDVGIDNVTAADGLAVGRPSRFVGQTIEPLLSGSYTVSDQELFKLLKAMADTENIQLEPSALAGAIGPVKLSTEKDGKSYIHQQHLTEHMKNAVHTHLGDRGSMVPKEIMEEYLSACHSDEE